MWAPYQATTYRAALAMLQAGWHVLDIGAGDLRFARQAAALGCRVTAVEIQPGQAVGPPQGVTVIAADAREWPYPPGIDAAVLLMRHCAFYPLVVRKLRQGGCPRLITNARWGLHVECVPLGPGEPFGAVSIGWWACVRCGEAGFQPGDPDALTASDMEHESTVEGCPACSS
ncbi:MAG: SAM-dependent methyltransferase [Anaerolineae bacterium]